jgi:protein TonB
VHGALLLTLAGVLPRPTPLPEHAPLEASVGEAPEPRDPTDPLIPALEEPGVDAVLGPAPTPRLEMAPPADLLDTVLPQVEGPAREAGSVPFGTLELPRAVAVWALAEREALRRPPPPAVRPLPVPPTVAPPTPPSATRQGAAELRLVVVPDPARYYPWLARRQGLEGEVIVRIEVAPQGGVVAAEVAVSSGHRLLDDAALRVAAATRFAPGAGGAAELPIRFRLR